MSIYSLTNSYKQIEQQLLDEDCDQESFIALLDNIKSDIKEKIVNNAFIIKNFTNTISGIEEAIELMKNRKDALKNKIEHLKKYSINSMVDMNIKKIESDYFNVSVSESLKIVVDNEEIIPIEFMRYKTVSEPDKIKIKEHLKQEGAEPIQGVHAEINKNLQIK